MKQHLSNLKIILPWLILMPLYGLLGLVGYWGFVSATHTPIVISEYVLENRAVRGITEFKPKMVDGYWIFQPGDQLTISTNSLRKESCTLIITRILKNIEYDFEYNLNSSVRRTYPKATPLRISNVILIPYSVLPGKYELFSTISVTCNPFQVYFPYIINTASIKMVIEPVFDDALFPLPKLDELKEKQ
jgi:hypothetical protein